MKKISILCLSLLCFLFSQSQIRYLKGKLQGSQETPPNTDTGSGVIIVKYDMSTKTLELFGDYVGLTIAIHSTASHLHEGAPGVAGPIVAPIVNTGGTSGILSGNATLTQAQEDSLLAGNMYANLHTTPSDAGELRAQLTPATNGQSILLSGRLQGAQETPPNTSTATGSVNALLDMGTDSMFVTGNFKGLTTTAISAHVHLALPGSPGNILFPVSYSPSTAGIVHADTMVSKADAATIAAGGSYLNVHSTMYPKGEIRAQLVNNVTMRYFAGNMSGANETPPNPSAARGTVIVSFNTQTNVVQLAGDYQKLSDTVTAAHIHLGAPGVAGPVIVPLTTSRDSTGTITAAGALLTDSQATALLSGNMYVNVHSAKFPMGEIRTQLTPTTSGETQVFAVNLSGTQQVPSNTSTATGSALVILDKTTGLTYETGYFSGINSNVTGAHIHRGQVGVSGPVILALIIVQRSPVPHSGTFSGSGTLSAPLIDSMINGLTYIDVHSSFFTAGAIRAQLGDLVLPVKLTYLNAYKQRNQIELVWETAEELNVSRYEIEQLNTSTQQWITKGSVPSQGGSTAASYGYADMPNLYGNQYLIYRLKILDKDGTISYSYLVKVNFEKLNAELFIQTNPVINGELKYTITGLSTNKKAEVSIVDYNGRLILRNSISSLMSNTLSISQLPAGVYKLIVKIDDTVLQKSFVK